jgi:hypothetical protein
VAPLPNFTLPAPAPPKAETGPAAPDKPPLLPVVWPEVGAGLVPPPPNPAAPRVPKPGADAPLPKAPPGGPLPKDETRPPAADEAPKPATADGPPKPAAGAEAPKPSAGAEAPKADAEDDALNAGAGADAPNALKAGLAPPPKPPVLIAPALCPNSDKPEAAFPADAGKVGAANTEAATPTPNPKLVAGCDCAAKPLAAGGAPNPAALC